ncbi:4-alpha-glucanotransferase [Roseospira visakhapatnamensis]|uniref:4-alpha-glucanotransferase n=1 Tax=Roseospira visakhapatnamensis TaxID=390880 RepID=A0A7W6RBB5_9PROT|nr:4-alpha-glucanotransferase [Roseospira visakhapatnamensis]MBB4265275.1 4-alpha-glucanotransferase [Roseospira visakhapatnamensis]
MSREDSLEMLARRAGLLPEYWDAFGTHAVVSETTKRIFLAGMGMAVADDGEVDASLKEMERRAWSRMLPPCLVLRCDADGLDRLPLAVSVPEAARDRALSWSWRPDPTGLVDVPASAGDQAQAGTLSLSDGAVVGGATVGGVGHLRLSLAVPLAVTWGYHHLAVSVDGVEPVTVTVIVAPWRCYLPAALTRGERMWGPTVQVYALRGRDDWGMGDFNDLRHLVALSAREGASVVGLNPLHALFPTRPGHASPYSPSSRLFLNPLYIHVPSVPELADSDHATAILETPGFRERLDALTATDLIDHTAVHAAKWPVLEALYKTFRARDLDRDTDRDRAFQAFRAARGRPLRLFAIYQVLAETFADVGHSYHDWPADYHHPDAPAVAAFAAEHAVRVTLHEYLQFEADRQLGRCCDEAQGAGMPVGLYHDLALGADSTGADAWILQDLVVEGVAVGAPPDPLNLNGQNWGFPPLNPVGLRERAYDAFVEVLRASMRHAGALRIDHVLGLMRMFWIPREGQAQDGGYVFYPFDEMLAVLALESHRNRCVVVGEDLGTVPEGFRERMNHENILSYRLMVFERHMDQSLKTPGEYPAMAVVAVATHDLPTLRGFWTGHDLQVKNDLQLFPSAEVYDRERRARADDRDRILSTLRDAGIDVTDDGSGATLSSPLSEAIHRFIASTPSLVLLLQLEDALGEMDQANVPGTVSEHPNWRRRLSVPVEALHEHEGFRALVHLLREARPRAATGDGAAVANG